MAALAGLSAAANSLTIGHAGIEISSTVYGFWPKDSDSLVIASKNLNGALQFLKSLLGPEFSYISPSDAVILKGLTLRHAQLSAEYETVLRSSERSWFSLPFFNQRHKQRIHKVLQKSMTLRRDAELLSERTVRGALLSHCNLNGADIDNRSLRSIGTTSTWTEVTANEIFGDEIPSQPPETTVEAPGQLPEIDIVETVNPHPEADITESHDPTTASSDPIWSVSIFTDPSLETNSVLVTNVWSEV